MKDKDLRYSIEVTDHRSGQRFRVDLFANYFAPTRNFMIEINGRPSETVQ